MSISEKNGADDTYIENVTDSNDNQPRPDAADVEVAAFGTKLAFTPEEERALVRKIDWRIMPVVTVLYLINFIDRSNVGNAKVAGLEADVGLVGYQYNIGLSVFYIMYALSEVPSNLLLKRFGANVWLPTIVLGFGFVSFITAWVKNFGGFLAVRIFLGLFEGGTMPGIAYYLSTYYKRHELVFRIGIFVSGSSASGAFGGLLASALLKIPQLNGLPHGRWRNIFLIEGLVTMLIAFTAYWALPSAPETAKFLSERESAIATERLRIESAGLSHPEKTDWKLVKRAFRSANNWFLALNFLLCNIPAQGVSLFLPTILKGMGYSTIQSQLHSVPPYILASFWSIGLAYCSFKVGVRGFFLLFTTPIAIAGAALLVGSGNHKVNYAGVFLLAMGIYPQGPLILAWATNNAAPHTTRAVSSAMVISFGSLGPIVSSWAYLPSDGPRYITGNSILLGALVGLWLLSSFIIFWNHRENRLRAQGKRDYRLQADDETIANLGHLHPRFRLTL